MCTPVCITAATGTLQSGAASLMAQQSPLVLHTTQHQYSLLVLFISLARMVGRTPPQSITAPYYGKDTRSKPAALRSHVSLQRSVQAPQPLLCCFVAVAADHE
jgi:hypothetical protein